MTLFAFSPESCRRLAEELGTPSFVYRASRFRDRYQLLRAALPDRVRIAYAVKANPGAGFLAAAHELGLSLDCASQGELTRALAAGFTGSRLFFAGPGKRAEEIRSVLELGARLQAEGMEDLRRAEEIAIGLGLQEVVVNLRVQPAEVAGRAGFSEAAARRPSGSMKKISARCSPRPGGCAGCGSVVYTDVRRATNAMPTVCWRFTAGSSPSASACSELSGARSSRSISGAGWECPTGRRRALSISPGWAAGSNGSWQGIPGSLAR